MSATKLTETRWADRCVMLPPRLNGAAAQRVVKKLVDLGLIEEVRARGDLPVWRREPWWLPHGVAHHQRRLGRIRIGPSCAPLWRKTHGPSAAASPSP